MTKIDRDEVRRLAATGAVVIEVLPEEEYEVEHLPGAINIPLKRLDRQTVVQLDRDHPTVVYCNDGE